MSAPLSVPETISLSCAAPNAGHGCGHRRASGSSRMRGLAWAMVRTVHGAHVRGRRSNGSRYARGHAAGGPLGVERARSEGGGARERGRGWYWSKARGCMGIAERRSFDYLSSELAFIHRALPFPCALSSAFLVKRILSYMHISNYIEFMKNEGA